jgi:hypothetical protein
LQQHWETSSSPDWLTYFFDPVLVHGDIIEFEYYLKYHPSFVANPGPWPNSTLKHILFEATGGSALYWDSNDGNVGGDMLFQFTGGVGGSEHFAGNINGGSYGLPRGEWVHIRVQIKWAMEGGAEDGYLKVWINGTQRWDHTDIYNLGEDAEVTNMELNPTHNGFPAGGSTQKRWWDLFSITKL